VASITSNESIFVSLLLLSRTEGKSQFFGNDSQEDCKVIKTAKDVKSAKKESMVGIDCFQREYFREPSSFEPNGRQKSIFRQ